MTLVIFDLDGTLLDSNGLWMEVDVEFLARRALAPTAEYEAVVARSIFPVAADYTKQYYRLPDSPADIMAEWEALAAGHYRETVSLKPGARALLDQYRAQGRPMALFTACRPELCRIALERFDLAGYFSHLVYAEELGLDKHDPACFLRLGQLLATPPAQCVLIDDSPSNCATARRAGMAVIGVFDPFYADRQEQLRAVCHRYVHSLEELLEM